MDYGASKQAAIQRRAYAAKFVLKKGSTGKYRFNLAASNGQVRRWLRGSSGASCAHA